MNKFITREEYLQEKGIDLNIEVQDDDNKSNKVFRFISEVTHWCIEHLMTNYDCNELLGRFDALPEWRQDRFRQGVIEQIEYILNEGWINKDSGYRRDTGTIVDFAKVRLGPSAYQKFKLGAFCNIARSH